MRPTAKRFFDLVRGWNGSLCVACTTKHLYFWPGIQFGRTKWWLWLRLNQAPRCEKWLVLSLKKNGQEPEVPEVLAVWRSLQSLLWSRRLWMCTQVAVTRCVHDEPVSIQRRADDRPAHSVLKLCCRHLDVYTLSACFWFAAKWALNQQQIMT